MGGYGHMSKEIWLERTSQNYDSCTRTTVKPFRRSAIMWRMCACRTAFASVRLNEYPKQKWLKTRISKSKQTESTTNQTKQICEKLVLWEPFGRQLKDAHICVKLSAWNQIRFQQSWSVVVVVGAAPRIVYARSMIGSERKIYIYFGIYRPRNALHAYLCCILMEFTRLWSMQATYFGPSAH